MGPELKERLECHAVWHEASALGDPFKAEFHCRVAADIRAAIVSADALVDAAKKADDVLTDSRIGTWPYMEGSEIYGDFREASNALRSAIGAKS